MAEGTNQLAAAGTGFQAAPFAKQVGMLLGISASVAIGFYVVLWSQSKDFMPIYSKLDMQDAHEVIEALQQIGVPYKLDENMGTVLVEKSKLYDARIKLSAKGLPNGAGVGMEILNESKGLGTSRFVENARYRQGLEGELSRTITSIKAVKNARVHLAIPRQSVFVRDRRAPSASVMVELFGGRTLERRQVLAIVHLVSSSIPELSEQDVTVIDQNGNLLSSSGTDVLAVANQQLDFVRQYEESYSKRINEILTPIVGPGRVKSKVSVNIDFTAREETAESFDPESASVRSEYTIEENKSGSGIIAGVPGALSNQPPAEGRADDEGGPAGGNSSNSSRKQSTKNYELDKRMRYTRVTPGKLRRVTAAVVVDDLVTYDNKGKETRTPRTEAQLKHIESLIKDAIGFDAERGDKISLINNSFVQLPAPPEAEPVPVFEQPWFTPLVKQVLAGLFVLLLTFMVLRPMIRNLASKGEGEKLKLEYETLLKNIKENPALLTGGDQNLAQEASLDQKLSQARTVINDDSARVAQVVKNWVGDENG